MDPLKAAALRAGSVRRRRRREGHRPIEHTGGIVRVPDGPGLGIEVNREALARLR